MPSESALVVQVACPVLRATPVQPEIALPLSLKVTVPVGGPGAAGLTFTKKSALCPAPEGFAEEKTSVVVAAFAIWNDCWTLDAALKLESPGCEAVTVQLPAPLMVMVLPFVPPEVQLPEAEKLTARPEVAVALTVNGWSPKVLFDRAPNVIV